jgi:hypothetical protein
MVCATDPIVVNSPFDYIPFHKETVLGTLGSNSDLPDIVLIQTYAEYLEIKQVLQDNDRELINLFSYEESFFEQFSVVLIKFHHLQSEQLLGVAGLVTGSSLDLPGSDALDEDVQTLAAVIKIDSAQTNDHISITDLQRSYITAEIKKSAYGEFDATVLYAYNVNEGTPGGAMNPGFPPTVE